MFTAAPTKDTLPSADLIAGIISILANPTILAIIRVLNEHPGSGVHEISASLTTIGVTTVRTNVCNHLRNLRHAGLVERRSHGGHNSYFVCSQEFQRRLQAIREYTGVTQAAVEYSSELAQRAV